jgi:hypothetical protein
MIFLWIAIAIYFVVAILMINPLRKIIYPVSTSFYKIKFYHFLVSFLIGLLWPIMILMAIYNYIVKGY